MIIILPVVFISMWYVLYKKERNLIEGLVQAEILYHVALLVLTNVFSIGNLLNRLTVLSGWLVVLFFVFFIAAEQGLLFAKGENRLTKGLSQNTFAKEKRDSGVKSLRQWWQKFSLPEKTMFTIMGVLFVVLFAGAVFTVPYNYDSMTYHLGRIGHWIDQGSVNHYVTNIDRQIYSPVMSEYEMLHMFLLAGSDSFLNLLQYFSMIVTAIILYAVARKLGTGRSFSMLAAFLFVTMPLTISQSITTQNDLLAAMWFAIFLYYFVDFINVPQITFDREQKKKLVLIGASVAFAFLTKTSICASMLFFMPWLVVVCLMRKDKILRLLQSALLAGGTLVVLISETLIRTYLSCGRLMADTTSANIMVSTKNVKYIIVNICKNFSLLITQHLIRPLNGVVYRFAIRVGSLLQVDFNNEAISYHGFDFLHHMNMGEDMYSHDKTPSAVVTYLALLAGIVLVVAVVALCVSKLRGKAVTEKGEAVAAQKQEKNSWYNRMSIGFAVSAWLSLGFIMALLRWQPWGTRLMYPALAMTVIMTANVAGAVLKEGTKAGQVGLAFLIVLSTLFCISPTVYNMQPAVENLQAGCENRMRRYFRFNDRYTAYNQLIDKTEELGFKTIGLSISGDGYDYPLWLMYRKEDADVLLYHVILDEDDTENIDNQTKQPDCILYVEHGAISVGEQKTYHGTAYECVYVSDANPDAPDAVLVKVE